MTWHPGVRAEGSPGILELMRIFAAYRFALIEGPKEGAAGVSEAFSYVSEALAAGLVEDRLNYLARQKHKSEMGRTIEGCCADILPEKTARRALAAFPLCLRKQTITNALRTSAPFSRLGLIAG